MTRIHPRRSDHLCDGSGAVGPLPGHAHHLHGGVHHVHGLVRRQHGPVRGQHDPDRGSDHEVLRDRGAAGGAP